MNLYLILKNYTRKKNLKLFKNHEKYSSFSKNIHIVGQFDPQCLLRLFNSTVEFRLSRNCFKHSNISIFSCLVYRFINIFKSFFGLRNSAFHQIPAYLEKFFRKSFVKNYAAYNENFNVWSLNLYWNYWPRVKK